MRALLPILLVSCTFNGSGPTPVTARPPPDPDRMPSEVLEKQDPTADTSKHPVLSKTSAHYVDQDSPWRGCMRMLACNAGGDGSDASAVLIVLAVLGAVRRRKTS